MDSVVKSNSPGENSTPSSAWQRLHRENLALRQELEELRSLREVAYRDSLTGLRNRRYFDERLSEELSRFARHSHLCGALVAVDLDDFKIINDQRGHLVGDETLQEIARLLEATIRLEDVCCRTGGDEFMIILPLTDLGGARQALRRLRAAVARRNESCSLQLDLSLGFASWPADGCTADVLMAAADRSLYQDKCRTARPSATKVATLRLV